MLSSPVALAGATPPWPRCRPRHFGCVFRGVHTRFSLGSVYSVVQGHEIEGPLCPIDDGEDAAVFGVNNHQRKVVVQFDVEAALRRQLAK